MITKQANVWVAAAAAAAFTLGVVPLQGPGLEGRVKDLEQRVAKLEAARAASSVEAMAPRVGEFVVPVTLSNKRLLPANPSARIHQDSIRYDSRYDFTALQKDTRAIKGVVEFRDLFGEVKLELNVTLSDPVRAGAEHRADGVGFEFDPLRESHRWMQATAVKDMHVALRVKQILYADGARAEFR
jgi:hypothetical protein